MKQNLGGTKNILHEAKLRGKKEHSSWSKIKKKEHSSWSKT